MYHSITFGDGTRYPSGHPKYGQMMGANTWDDWHLIPSKRPSVSQPGIATNLVTIPGRDGSIDLTELVRNRPIYGDRSGSFDFIVDNDHENWEVIRWKIVSTLHGKRMKMVLEDDPGYYWEGRFSVGDWETGPWYSTITISYVVGPYKFKIDSSDSYDIIWDLFDFENDYDYYAALHNIVLNNSTYTATIIGRDYPFPVSATLTTNGEVTASFGGVTKTLTPNAPYAELGRAAQGENTLTVSGTGTVSISFQGGML